MAVHGFMHVFTGEKWLSEKGKIILEIQLIFKIPTNDVITYHYCCQPQIFKILQGGPKKSL